jgi:hypothetical protein
MIDSNPLAALTQDLAGITSALSNYVDEATPVTDTWATKLLLCAARLCAQVTDTGLTPTPAAGVITRLLGWESAPRPEEQLGLPPGAHGQFTIKPGPFILPGVLADGTRIDVRTVKEGDTVYLGMQKGVVVRHTPGSEVIEVQLGGDSPADIAGSAMGLSKDSDQPPTVPEQE